MIEFRKKLFLFYVVVFSITYGIKNLNKYISESKTTQSFATEVSSDHQSE